MIWITALGVRASGSREGPGHVDCPWIKGKLHDGSSRAGVQSHRGCHTCPILLVVVSREARGVPAQELLVFLDRVLNISSVTVFSGVRGGLRYEV